MKSANIKRSIIAITILTIVISLAIFVYKNYSVNTVHKTQLSNTRGDIKTNDNIILATSKGNETNREYPLNDTCSPLIGLTERENNNQSISGTKGLEKSHNSELNKRIPLVINIHLKLQAPIETILDIYKKELGADEIIVSVMDSETGKILVLATSNRFNPNSIKTSDSQYLNNNAIELEYEPGSVIKPLTIALALEKNKIKITDEFSALNYGKKNKDGEYPNGIMEIGQWNISDHQQFKKHTLTIEDIITRSSNIGTVQIARELSGKEILDGFNQFGITRKTGIELLDEKVGNLPTLAQVSAGELSGNLNIFKSTISYGQGVRTTFMQLLKAYNVFNNNGNIISPSIIKTSLASPQEKVLSDETTNIMKDLLIKTVDKENGHNPTIQGLEIGGKNGTANIFMDGKYQQKYISSFFGFVNDKERKYTIGVAVNNPTCKGKKWYYYHASNSSVPVFQKVVGIMIKNDYLKQSK